MKTVGWATQKKRDLRDPYNFVSKKVCLFLKCLTIKVILTESIEKLKDL